MNVMNVSINVITLIFYLFLVGIFLSKKNMDTYENRLYKMLLLFNGLDLVMHLLFLIIGGLRLNGFILTTVSALHCVCLLLCMFFVCFYMIFVSLEKNKPFEGFFNKNKKKIHLYIGIFWIIFSIISFIIPLEPLYDSNNILIGATGPLSTVLTSGLIIMLLISFIVVIKNRKNADRKKIMPIYLVVLLVIVSFSLMVILPTICIAVVMLTLVSFVMYHTIENPDMKMVAELQLAKNAAEKANNAKSDFLSSMSHELRTPLNAIVGLTQSIMDADNLDTVKEDSKDILTASEKLLELVDSILDINKLESNNMELIPVNYAPIEVFNDLVKVMGVRIGDKPIELRTRFSEDLPITLYGDKDKIKQVITNLISNAIKYTDSGTVDFSVDCINKDNKCNLRISVSDSGRGIKEEELNNLFTKFYRREEDKDTDVEGAGLGLAITKSLVDLMGGKISVDSIDGVGTTFLVSISQDIISNSINNEESEVL